MLAEILTIGDELCRGEIVDTNSSWLAEKLWDLGITVAWMTSCRDERADVARAFREAAGRAAVVLVSGGLGPTEDDLTVDALCEVAGVEPVIDQPSHDRMVARFQVARFALTPNNLRQVRIPLGARVHPNPAGIAPGFELPLGSSTVFVMPGVPREVHAIFDATVAARLGELLAGDEIIARRVYRVFGKGESHIDHALAGLAGGAAGVTVHYQVTFPETLVKLVVRDRDPAAAAARLDQLDGELRRRLGELVYGLVGEPLPLVMGRELARRKATLAVAESCTGGMLGSIITEVPGSSEWFKGGVIAYANEVKVRELGVTPETLAAHGAVSQAAVEEMALGARRRFDTTYAAAVCGVAGPTGGTPEKPVGTVHIAVAGPDAVRHRQLQYPGARDQIRRLSAYWAMKMVLEMARA
jgi:nicotinamide-nucleotide amidase